eukprot:CAMPEP_0185837608 /NCGR_PEP_ID=MMETSP1353-20130828/11681_1 /TAXON_ID=1077150 /ORGANISM="Erythrolobus australicus, Strain CCMP3124" /LENGTH=687 /DNA_ID=CAMNT_0028536547 /DNA_START=120 /DNA_END=2180 /DNA_ORIENTATION=-
MQKLCDDAAAGRERASSKSAVSKGLRVGKYVLKEVLGQGFYAEVRRAEHADTRAQFAVKVIDRKRFPVHVIEKQIRAEIRAMQALCHPNIVAIHQVLMSGTRIYLVMEYVSGGELFAHIQKTQRLAEQEARKLFSELVDAVAYCHSRGVYHRDLKVENILLSRDGCLKITDFGMSWVREAASDGSSADELLYTRCGTPEYLPPEVLLSHGDSGTSGYRGDKLDAWSCGIVLYTMLAGGLPLWCDSVESALSVQRYSIYYPSWFSSLSISLLQRLLEQDPERRWSVNQCRRHEWFADVSLSPRESELQSARDVGAQLGVLPTPPCNIDQGTIFEPSPLRRSRTLKADRAPSVSKSSAIAQSYSPSGERRDGVLVRAGSIDSTIDMKRREALLEMAKFAQDRASSRDTSTSRSPAHRSFPGKTVELNAFEHGSDDAVSSQHQAEPPCACSGRALPTAHTASNSEFAGLDGSEKHVECEPPLLTRRKSYSSPVLAAPALEASSETLLSSSEVVEKAVSKPTSLSSKVSTPRSSLERLRREKLKKIFLVKDRTTGAAQSGMHSGGSDTTLANEGALSFSAHQLAFKDRLHRELRDKMKPQLASSAARSSGSTTPRLSRNVSYLKLRQRLRLDHGASLHPKAGPQSARVELPAEHHTPAVCAKTESASFPASAAESRNHALQSDIAMFRGTR